MNDSGKVDFDDYAQDYDALLSQGTTFFADADYFAEYKVALAAQVVTGPVTRVHEFGCGTGRNLPLIRKYFPAAHIWGSDISRKSLELAAAACPDATLWQEGVATPSPECDSQDLVFVAGVFHHIAPVQRCGVMHLLATRLRAGGSLVVFEHNPYNPVTRRIVAGCPFDADAVLLKAGELEQLGVHTGLTHRRTQYTLFFPRLLDKLRELERYLGWLPLGGQYMTLFHKR